MSRTAGAQVLDIGIGDVEAVSGAAPRATFTVSLSPGRIPAALRGPTPGSTTRVRVRAVAHPPGGLAVQIPEPQEVIVELATSGESKSVSVDFTAREEWARVSVQLDPRGEIAETDETNNYAEALFGTPGAVVPPEDAVPPGEPVRPPPRPGGVTLPERMRGRGEHAPPVADERAVPVMGDLTVHLLLLWSGNIYNRSQHIYTEGGEAAEFDLGWHVQTELPAGTGLSILLSPGLVYTGMDEEEGVFCQTPTAPAPDPPLNEEGTYLLCETTSSGIHDLRVHVRAVISEDELSSLPEDTWVRRDFYAQAQVDWAEQVAETDEDNNAVSLKVTGWACNRPPYCSAEPVLD